MAGSKSSRPTKRSETKTSFTESAATRRQASSTSRACAALEELVERLKKLARLGGGPMTGGLLHAAADDCPEGVLVTNGEAQIEWVNGAAARLLGLSTRELQRLTVWDITHASSQEDFDVLWREFLRAGRQRGVYTFRHQTGAPLEMSYCAQTDVLPARHILVLHRLA